MKTLENLGVGGGITARTQIAHALQKNGHDVSMFVNFPGDERIMGVQYRHFSRIEHIDSDVLVLSTSGGQLDLGSIRNIDIHSRFVVLMLSGVEFPRNISQNDFSFVYIPSNFMASVARDHWKIDPKKIFTVNYGVLEENFNPKFQKNKDDRKLVYMSHPSKGLEPALAVLRLLRKQDPSFSLHVFGGMGLWGEKDNDKFDEPGVYYHGLVGQRKLARFISGCGFSINLQSREEPFGIVIPESMKAGCIVIASPVGAYPEMIQHGHNGFLNSGDPVDPKTIEKAADLILALVQHPDYLEFVRNNAIYTPMNWQTLAKAWEGHWDWYLRGNSHDRSNGNQSFNCARCNGRLLMFSDGLHCTECGNYQRSIDSQRESQSIPVREI